MILKTSQSHQTARIKPTDPRDTYALSQGKTDDVETLSRVTEQ